MKNKPLRYLCEAGIIAACYAALTYLSSVFGLAYGPVQFRFSEALCILPLLTPAAIPGLTLGCFIANLGSSLGVIDWVVGTLATLLGALLCRCLRKFHPTLSVLSFCLTNGILVGLELCWYETGSFSFSLFMADFFWVFLGEAVVGFLLGLPLYYILRKSKLYSR